MTFAETAETARTGRGPAAPGRAESAATGAEAARSAVHGDDASRVDDASMVVADAESASSAEEPEWPVHGTAAFDATGDPTVMPSWDELVREHADRVYRLAYRLSGNVHDAEDLTQETFIRVFRSLNSYRAGTFEGWLHRITTNLFLDMVRRRNRIRMEALPDDYDRVPSDTPDPEQIYHDARLAPDLQRALASLAPEFRAAVVLCDVEGLSYEEIAATLGVKLGTVRSRIHRGRQAIRDYLAQVSDEAQVTDGQQVGAGLAGVDGPPPSGTAGHAARRRRTS